MATRGLNSAELKRWTIRGAGEFAILDRLGADISPRGRKARAILAYLSTQPNLRAPREKLMNLLWGDRGEAQARASLRQALLEIRQATGDLLQADRDSVWIDAGSASIDRSDSAGELFDNLNHITPEYDEWMRGERERFRKDSGAALRREVEKLLDRGRGAEALPLIERLQGIDPYNEDALRLALQAEFQAGHPAEIERRFKEAADLLSKDLGVAPAGETRALRDRLLSELARVPEPAPAQEAPGTTVVPPVEVATPIWRRRKWVAAASIAALAASGGLLYKATSAPAEPPRLAVLPFAAGAGVDPALAEGLSDELHGELARNGQIRVIGRTSAAQFKGQPADLRDVGRKLGARYIVEGTVREHDGRVSIFVTLVQARDGSALWSRNFVGAANRLEAVEAAIGGEIGRSLGATALPVAKSPARGEAYALYLRAKGLLRNRDFESATKALELLRQANRIDPKFAGVWAQLAAAAHFTGQPYVELADGTRISRREAVARALRLDPNLAEAHAMAWLVEGGAASTEATRAHLRQALKLDPNDPQTLYWWGSVVRAAGDYRRGAEISRRVAELDPLWKRPVGAAIEASLDAGDRTSALNYLRRIKAGNPEGAREVEVAMAFYEADYSRAVQLAFGDRRGGWDDGKSTAAGALFDLGFERQALLIYPFLGPFERATLTGRTPPLPAILDRLPYYAAKGDPWFYEFVIWKLAREKRWSDIAAIYDANVGLIRDVRGSDPGGTTMRVAFGPMLALCLHKAGRTAEAARLALASDAAANVILANGGAPAPELVSIAGNEAILGRRDDALAHLEQAFAKGWRMSEDQYSRLADNPIFATLRGQPRFERLRRIQEAHFAKERREILALGII